MKGQICSLSMVSLILKIIIMATSTTVCVLPLLGSGPSPSWVSHILPQILTETLGDRHLPWAQLILGLKSS